MPSEGDVLTGVFGIGHADGLMPDEKPIASDDILVNTMRVLEANSWPIRATVTPGDERGWEITKQMYFPSDSGLNGVHLSEERQIICFPFEATSDNRYITRDMERDELLKSLSVNNEVFLVDDYELRRCKHPSNEMERIQTSQAASLGARILTVGANASLSGEEAWYCKKCKSVLESDEGSDSFF